MSEIRTGKVLIPITVTFYSIGENGRKAVFGIAENTLDVEPNILFVPDQSNGVDAVTASDLMPTAIRMFNMLSNEWLLDGKIPSEGKNSWKPSSGPNGEKVIFKEFKNETIPAGRIEKAEIKGKITMREQNIHEVKELFLALAGNSLIK